MNKFVVGLTGIGAALRFFGTASADGLMCSNESGCKACSGVNPGAFRDTTIVPQTWSPATCQAFAQQIGTNSWQLGCFNQDSFVFGAPQSTAVSTPNLPPDDTCGWAPR